MKHNRTRGKEHSPSPEEIRAAYDKKLEQYWLHTSQATEAEREEALEAACAILSTPDQGKPQSARSPGASEPAVPDSVRKDLRPMRLAAVLITGLLSLVLLTIFLANTVFHKPLPQETDQTETETAEATDSIPEAPEENVFVDEQGNIYQMEPGVTYVGIRTITLGDEYTAQTLYALWQLSDQSEASMISIMDEYGSGQGGGKLYLIKPGIFLEEIEDWCFAPERAVSDTAVIGHEEGFSLCFISKIIRPGTVDARQEQYQFLADAVAADAGAYLEYIGEVNRIASKGTDGKERNKEEVMAYINALPLDQGEKQILCKIGYPQDSSCDQQITAYLRGREDITSEETGRILICLGLAELADGEDS